MKVRSRSILLFSTISTWITASNGAFVSYRRVLTRTAAKMAPTLLLLSADSSSDAAARQGGQDDSRIRNNISSSLPPSVLKSNKSHERAMEALSAEGAARIAQLSTSARAKRAMLAEAVEDQIFANTEQLEMLLLQADNGTNMEDDDENRNDAVELAQQTRTLQVQYRELVMGESSSVLNALESVIRECNNSSGSDIGDDNVNR